VLRSSWFLILFYPFTALCICICLALRFVGNADLLHSFARWWGRGCLCLAGVKLTVEGEDRLPVDRPVIYMANHQGNFDIPALFAGLPGQFRWMAKAELFRVPFFGLVLRCADYIPVERGEKKKALASLKEAACRISGGTSVMIFPEGTRSPDGLLQPFKKGGFLLAKQARVDIVPIVISGSAEVMPKHSLRLFGREIRLRILPSVSSTSSSRGSEFLMQDVFQAIAAEMAADQAGQERGSG